MSDSVNHPSHYTQYPVEVIESMKNLCTHEEFVGYLKCNIIKYLARYRYKNKAEDLQKLEFYRKRLEDFEYGE